MARITWQNVAAPDFDTALRAAAGAGNSFQSAFDDIGSTFKELHGQRKEAMNNQAMEKMLQFGDVGSWDQATAGGALGALGIGSDMASADLMRAVQGRRGDLAQDRQTDLNYQQDGFNLERAQTLANRNDVAYDRSEEDRSRGLQAQQLVNQMAERGLSRDAMAREIRNQNLDPRMEQDAFAQLDGLHGVHFEVGPGTSISDPATAGAITNAQDYLALERQNLDFRIGTRPELMVMMNAEENYGSSSDHLNTMLDRLKSRAGSDGEEDFGRSKGASTALFNKLRRENPNVPASIIAQVMEGELSRNWSIWADERRRQDFNTSAITDQLAVFNDPALRNDLQRESVQVGRERQRLSDAGNTIDRLQQDLLLALERGSDPSRIAELQGQIQQVVQGMNLPGQEADGAEIVTGAMDAAVGGSGGGTGRPEPQEPNRPVRDTILDGTRDTAMGSTLQGTDMLLQSLIPSYASRAAGNYARPAPVEDQRLPAPEVDRAAELLERVASGSPMPSKDFNAAVQQLESFVEQTEKTGQRLDPAVEAMVAEMKEFLGL